MTKVRQIHEYIEIRGQFFVNIRLNSRSDDKWIDPGCFVASLDASYRDLIADFERKFSLLQEYCQQCFDSTLQINVTWKVHILCTHLPQWLDKHPTGMSQYAEQAAEASHADFARSHKRFRRSESHPDHGKLLLRSVCDYSSRRIQTLAGQILRFQFQLNLG